jgi:hypothetical protein
MDIAKLLEEKEMQFNALVEKKNLLSKEILGIDEELLRIQGEYRVLTQLGQNEDAVKEPVTEEAVEPEN